MPLDRVKMREMVGEQVYLGDAVYAEFDPACMITLWTDRHRGYGPDRIALEPEVFLALLRFAAKIGWLDLIKGSLKND